MRNLFKYIFYALKTILFIPVLLMYLFSKNKTNIQKDIERLAHEEKFNQKGWIAFIHFTITDPYFRTVLFYRLGGICKFYQILINNHDFHIQHVDYLGGAIRPVHAYATVINAKSIGSNFTIRQCTTIGNKIDGRNDLTPTIGNNVTLGSNVVIIGNIQIGNNVIIGAGSVVTHDIPDNCVVAGNPAKIIKTI